MQQSRPLSLTKGGGGAFFKIFSIFFLKLFDNFFYTFFLAAAKNKKSNCNLLFPTDKYFLIFNRPLHRHVGQTSTTK